MRSAGLKNITAKHLALASQSLSVVVVLMESLKGLGKRFMGERWGMLEGEFGKLKRVRPIFLNVDRAKNVTDLRNNYAI